MDPLKDILIYLADQHRELKLKLEVCETELKESHGAEFIVALKDFQNILIRHHEEEFEILIKKAGVHPRCREGGPFCTYYFDVYGYSRPLDEARVLLKKVSENTPELVLPERYKPLFAINSPTTIPLEEHLAMEFLTEHLLRLDQETVLSKKDVVMSAIEYLSKCLRFNAQKEEQCFFSLCQSILSAEDKAELSSAWMKRATV